MASTPMEGRAEVLATFGIQGGTRAGEEVPVPSPVVRMGSGKGNDIVVPDDSVSASHAILEYEDGGWRLTDLQSTNGTFVEGVRLAPEVPTPLPYGSTVRLGGVRLHFRSVAEADPEAARAAYTPPPSEARLADERRGFRVPVWVLILVLVLLVLAAIFFGWVWTPTPEPVPAPPPGPTVLDDLPRVPDALAVARFGSPQQGSAWR